MNKTVLIVDDETDIQHSIKRQLRKEPIELLFASTGKEGLRILQEKNVHLVISDHKMPGMSGVDFLRRVKQQRPEIVRILLSGYIETSLLINAINEGEVYRFIAKPWNGETLKTYITEALEHYDVLQKNRDLMQKVLPLQEKDEGGNGCRDRALQLTDAIIEELPYGIITISYDNTILQINSSAFNLLGIIEDPRGKQIRMVFSPDLCGFINTGLEEQDGQGSETFAVNGRQLTVRLRRLRQNIDREKGLIIIHE